MPMCASVSGKGLPLFFVVIAAGCGSSDHRGSSHPPSSGFADAAPDDARSIRQSGQDAGLDSPGEAPPNAAETPLGICTRVESTSQVWCTGTADCPVAFMTDFVCAGAGNGLQVLAAGDRAVINLAFGSSLPYDQVIWQLGTSGDELSLLAQRRAQSLLLRRGPSGEPLLVELEPNAVIVQDLSADAAVTRLETVHSPFDALYDEGGTLRVFTRAPTDSGETDFFRFPEESAPIVTGTFTQAQALVLTDGSVGFAFISPDGAPFGFWSEATGVLSAAYALPFSDQASFARHDSGVLASHLDSDALRVFYIAEASTTVMSYAPLPTDCNGTMQAYFPDICPTEVVSQTVGERALTQQVAIGRNDVPWVVSLEAQARYDCEWGSRNACIETVTCDCAQQGILHFESLDLHLRTVEPLPRSYSVPLGVPHSSSLAVAARPDGVLVVAVSWTEPGNSGQTQTHLRYIELTTG